MNVLRKLPTSIIFITSHIIFSSSTIFASAAATKSCDSYQDILMIVGSTNRQLNEHLQQNETITQNLLKAESTEKTLQLKVAQQDKTIKSQAATIKYLRETKLTHQRSLLKLEQDLRTNQLALSQFQKNERLLVDQNQQYKKLAILGGITTSLAIGFIVAEKYWDNR